MFLQREVEHVKVLEDMKAFECIDSVKSRALPIDSRLENFPDKNPSTAYATGRMPSRKKKLKVYYYLYK